MNMLRTKFWIKLGTGLKVKKSGTSITVTNNSNKHGFIIFPRVFKYKGTVLKIGNTGSALKGSSGEIKLLNRSRHILFSSIFNSVGYLGKTLMKYFILAVYVPAKSSFSFDSLEMESVDGYTEIFEDFFTGDTLLVSPGYASLADKGAYGFVHTRVKEYLKLGWDLDVAAISGAYNTATYEHEGVNVFKGNYFDLREVLQAHKYKRIFIHFFDENYANVLDSVDLTETKLYFFCHGAETLYWDWEKFTAPYFGEKSLITPSRKAYFQQKDDLIKKYNELPNVKWLFVTPWTQQRSEELIGIKYNNADIIPCLIDMEKFYYTKKDPELRKKIFMLRKFNNLNSYSIDTNVKVILELSKKPYFNELEFSIYGDGENFDRLLEPIKDFPNVKLHRTFLNHDQIKAMHEENGIALFATRFDSQAVSSCEAAASGCAVITSRVGGVAEFMPEEVMCESENVSEYVEKIDYLYNNPDEFIRWGKMCSDAISSRFDFEHTIGKEIGILENMDASYKLSFQEPLDEPVLTVVVPSYNVEKYLRHGVMSLINHRNAHKIEVLIVNDGSKDRTAEIGQELVEFSTVGDRSIVKLINKENGGHGSTINTGVRLARGRYFKVVDGDDTVDSQAFADLIDLLENESVDVVLNNYIEDFASDNLWVKKTIYDFMDCGDIYQFDNLCGDDGFNECGPILSCSSYRTQMLRDANVTLSEKCYYVDMELNTQIAIACNTIKYYPLDVYRYLLGRTNQSVSRVACTRNYKHHETVTLNMIRILQEHQDSLSQQKTNYIKNKLILPMIGTQYFITICYMKNGDAFREFDSQLKAFPEYYNNEQVCIKKVRYNRRFNGGLVRFQDAIEKIKTVLKRGT